LHTKSVNQVKGTCKGLRLGLSFRRRKCFYANRKSFSEYREILCYHVRISETLPLI